VTGTVSGIRLLASADGDAHLLLGLLLGLALGAGTLLPVLGQGGAGFPPPGEASGQHRPALAAAAGELRAPTLFRPGPKPAPADVLDLNGADAQTLAALPGIGPALAGRIVAEREARGPFASPEDLLRVPGIGPGRLERIRPFVTTARRP
jgi:competence ComEA-like helix-hairpin-helix protein